MRILFATDVHGSEVCFRKFLNAHAVYEPEVMIVGGDITGKVLVPIVHRDDGTVVGITAHEEARLGDAHEIARFERTMADLGSYTRHFEQAEYEAAQADQGRVDELFQQVVLDRIEAWMGLVEERLGGSGASVYMSGGNDDFWEVDEVLRSASAVTCPDRRVLELGGFEMLSYGGANETPWHCPRDMSEDELRAIYAELAGELSGRRPALFNLHPPPYGTTLDEAAKLDEDQRPKIGLGGAERDHVGSRAVRELVEQVEPRLSLHGHVHESQASARLGSTLALNPGSEYSQGLLRAALVDLKGEKVKRFQFIAG